MNLIRQTCCACVLLLSHSSGTAGNSGEIILKKTVQSAGGQSLRVAQGYRLYTTQGQPVISGPKFSGPITLRLGFWSPLVPQGETLFSDGFETVITRSES